MPHEEFISCSILRTKCSKQDYTFCWTKLYVTDQMGDISKHLKCFHRSHVSAFPSPAHISQLFNMIVCPLSLKCQLCTKLAWPLDYYPWVSRGADGQLPWSRKEERSIGPACVNSWVLFSDLWLNYLLLFEELFLYILSHMQAEKGSREWTGSLVTKRTNKEVNNLMLCDIGKNTYVRRFEECVNVCVVYL